MEIMSSQLKNSIFLKLMACFCLFVSSKPAISAPKTIDVVFMTQSGSRLLKSWTPEDLSRFAGNKSGKISAQEFLFEDSSNSLDLNDRAGIDLVTIHADAKIIRVPRFMIWRGFFQFRYQAKTGELSSGLKSKSSLDQGRILLPAWYFDTTGIRKIELSDRKWTYPNTHLKIRTNPAASRGEKTFTQNCMACHSIPSSGAPVLQPTALNADRLKAFETIHKKWPEIKIDARYVRGLIEYSEALAFEKNEVKPKK
jgi:hypothetical protein